MSRGGRVRCFFPVFFRFSSRLREKKERERVSSLFSFFPTSGPSLLFLFLSALVVDTILDETKMLFFWERKETREDLQGRKEARHPFSLSPQRGSASLSVERPLVFVFRLFRPSLPLFARSHSIIFSSHSRASALSLSGPLSPSRPAWLRSTPSHHVDSDRRDALKGREEPLSSVGRASDGDAVDLRSEETVDLHRGHASLG